MREPEAGLGSGYSTWFYSNQPDLFRHLPQKTRVYRAATALGPAGASWLRARVEGKFSVSTGRTVTEAAPDGDKVRLTVNGGGSREELTADHVIAATGYRGDLARLDFLGDDLRSQVNSVNRTAAVGRGYQSSVPGLYFVGPLVAPSFGPVMRFVFGSKHAAYSVTRQLVRSKG
jgi:thioredoxin reductase